MPDIRTRSKRERLTPRETPYYHSLARGVSLGYRKHRSGNGSWIARIRNGSAYLVRCIGPADDYSGGTDAVLTFREASTKVLALADDPTQLIGTDDRGNQRRLITIQDAADAYLADYQARSGKATKETRRKFERDILPDLGGVLLNDDNLHDKLSDWRQELVARKPRDRGGRAISQIPSPQEAARKRRASAQRIWSLLQAALNFAYRAQPSIDDSPWRRIPPLPDIEAPPPASFLSVRECQRLVNAADEEFRPILAATYLTGAAWKELREVRVFDYDREERTLRVFNTKRRSRHIPLTDEGSALFDAYTAGKNGDDLIFTCRDGTAWGKSQQDRPIREASERAGITPHVTLTQLRKAYGSLLLNAGVSLEIVSYAMGHSSIHVTRKHYTALLDKNIHDSIRAALPSLGLSSNVKRIA